MNPIIQQLKRFVDDERAVSPVVGFVLIFALVMIVFTIYQADVVPAQNKEVEFEHSQMVEGQIEQLSAAFVSTGPDDPPQAVSLQLGVQYPSRALAINPGTPIGSLDTTDSHRVELSGDGGSEEFNTSFVTYQPSYNMMAEEIQYSIEHGMVVKNYHSSGKTSLASPGALFSANGEAINLNLISGDVSANEMSTVVTTDNVDTHTINISSDSATLVLPTTLEEEDWEALLTNDDGSRIAQVSDYEYLEDSSEISIDLKNGTAVNLNKVSAGRPSDDDTLEIHPQITNVTSTTPSPSADGETRLTVRTSDLFESALSDIDITATATGSGNLTPAATTSNGSGLATFVYEPGPSDSGDTVEVMATLPNGSGGPDDSVTFRLDYPAENSTPNGTNREPINANKLQTGQVNQLRFKITPGPPVAVSGFSVVTKGEAETLNETSYSNQFQITDSKRIDGASSGYGPLRYAAGEPIQFDGQNYIFTNGPRRVVSSDVYLQQWPMSRGVTVNGFVDSYSEADIIVYFILQDGSRRPVYIDATVDN